MSRIDDFCDVGENGSYWNGDDFVYNMSDCGLTTPGQGLPKLAVDPAQRFVSLMTLPACRPGQHPSSKAKAELQIRAHELQVPTRDASGVLLPAATLCQQVEGRAFQAFVPVPQYWAELPDLCQRALEQFQLPATCSGPGDWYRFGFSECRNRQSASATRQRQQQQRLLDEVNQRHELAEGCLGDTQCQNEQLRALALAVGQCQSYTPQ